jgi:electron transport complex protein RnfC
VKAFRGGIHPPGKKISGGKKIENAALPPKVIIPLQQHIGAPAQPIVEVGAEVKKGQKIGEASGFVSSMIHASISGKVTEIADYLYPNPLGRTALSVVIESDGEDEWSEDIKPPENVDSLDVQQILSIIREAGIVGMGGATFPTNVKFSIPAGKKIDTIILNGVECEPYATPDHRIMLENSKKILDGLRIMMKIIGIKNGFIGIARNKPDAIQAMQEATRDETNIQIVPLKVRYPQGWENILIKAILDREVPPGDLPLDVGVIVANLGTAAAISDAMRLGYPLIERVVSITGPGIIESKNLRVRVGTPFSDLIEQCGGFKSKASKIVAGGPMMGFAMFDVNVPVVKGTTNILIFSDKDARIQEQQPCIKCGKCVSVCPVGLIPTMIASLSKKGKFEAAEEYFPLDCKECGCCAYICPAKIPLVQLIQSAKADIIARQRRDQ